MHLMPTFKACKDIHAQSTDADLSDPKKWRWLDAKIDHTSWQIRFPGGSTIQWFGAREADSARGIRCDVVTVDECDDIDPSVVDSVVQPWFSEPWSLATILYGGTPRRGRYGLLYREHTDGLDGDKVRAGMPLTGTDAEERAGLLRSKFTYHATYRDAPETVDARRVRQVRLNLESKGKLAIFRREWECDFDSAEGLVYPMFEPAVHVREPPYGTVFSEVIIGRDYGFEDPGVILVGGVVGHGADAVVYIIDEIYERQRIPSWWRAQAGKVVRRWPQARWYCDTSSPGLIGEDRAAGAKIAEDFSKPGSIEDSVLAVADRMAVRYLEDGTRYAKLYISPKCVNTIDELGKYRRKRDPRNADRFLDDIEDKNNHSCDSMRYMLVGRFGSVSRGRHDIGAGWE